MANNFKENFDALLEKCVTPNASGRECFSLAMLTDDDLKWMAENCPSWDWLSDVTDDGGNNLYDLCAEKGFAPRDDDTPHIIGKWAGSDIDVVEIDGSFYALNGWNGEKYLHCWKCADRFTADPDDDREYEIAPAYNWADFDEDTEEFRDQNGNTYDGIYGYEVA